ncbi:hypothetical protein ASD39_13625 [Sphingomonas sp. Root50]|nr:hypothetical protein ASD17_23825 [Sphingomonas sp. Root1294]KQY66119.1 hypothetical protein ASD39_13625 [Sphingomonas sp. Root50]
MVHGSPALAQAAAVADDGSPGEIVVTAGKRGNQTINDTPLSIQAFTGEQLTKNGVTQFSDYARTISGLAFEDNGPGDKKYVIRGIQSIGAATTGVYFDDIVLTGSNRQDGGGRQPDLKLIDMERIEVLKGPQGTLYGASSMSGTIRMLTNKPNTQDVGGAFNASAGTTHYAGKANYNFDGMLNVPIVQDVLAMRVVGYRSYDAGWLDNDLLGKKGVNSNKVTGGRIAVRWTPSSDVSLDLMAIRQDTDTNGAPYYQPRFGRRAQDTHNELKWNEKLQAYNAALNVDALSGTITATGSYSKRKILYTQESTRKLCSVFGAPANDPICKTQIDNPKLESFRSTLQQPVTREITNGELRYASKWEGKFQLVGGLFYEKDKDKFLSTIYPITLDNQIIPAANTTYVNRRVEGSVEQIAAFGELNYEILPGLTATVGARRFRFKIDQVGQNLVTRSRAVAAAPVFTSSKESGTTFKGGLSYKPSRDLLIYATYAEGFRAGGTNEPDLVTGTIFPPFTSDGLSSYEAGIKGQLFDRLIDYNLAAYYIDWTDLQAKVVSTSGGSNYVTNVGKARIKGVEGSVVLRPTREISIGGNFTILSAELAEDDPVGISGRVRALKGDRIPNVPEFTASGFVEDEIPVSDDWTLTPHADLTYYGSSYTDFRQQSVLYRKQGGYSVANLRLTLEGGPYRMSVFANNLFDSYGTQSWVLDAQRPDARVSVQPRTIGISAGYRF